MGVGQEEGNIQHSTMNKAEGGNWLSGLPCFGVSFVSFVCFVVQKIFSG
jgi:hypothetical protein